jgi:hypothetical protein
MKNCVVGSFDMLSWISPRYYEMVKKNQLITCGRNTFRYGKKMATTLSVSFHAPLEMILVKLNFLGSRKGMNETYT